MFEFYEHRVLDWAADKGLLDDLSVQQKRAQALKCVSEVGELADGVVKDNLAEVYDAIGDVAVTLIILADLYGTTVGDCVAQVYNEISSRTGKTVNGVFIKDEQ